MNNDKPIPIRPLPRRALFPIEACGMPDCGATASHFIVSVQGSLIVTMSLCERHATEIRATIDG